MDSENIEKLSEIMICWIKEDQVRKISENIKLELSPMRGFDYNRFKEIELRKGRKGKGEGGVGGTIMLGNKRDSFQWLTESREFRGFGLDLAEDYGYGMVNRMNTSLGGQPCFGVGGEGSGVRDTFVKEEKLGGGSPTNKVVGGKLPPIDAIEKKNGKVKGSFGGIGQGSDVGIDQKRYEMSIMGGRSGDSNIFSAKVPGGVHNVMTEPLSSAGFGKKADWKSGVELDKVYEEFGKLDEKQQKFVVEYLSNVHSAACEGNL